MSEKDPTDVLATENQQQGNTFVLLFLSGLVMLAYFQTSLGLEVASKSPVLCTRVTNFCVCRFQNACSVLRCSRQRIR